MQSTTTKEPTTMSEFEGITTAPCDPRHVAQVIDHIAHLEDEQVAQIRDELNRWAASVPAEPKGRWTYAFPDAHVNGIAKTITTTRDEALDHREIEDLTLRYGATSCEITPPGSAFSRTQRTQAATS